MEIEQIWIGNPGRNYNYLVACPETREAIAIDPLDSDAVIIKAKKRGWRIVKIINTHEHGDHTGGNAALVEAFGADVLAHASNLNVIPEANKGLRDGDKVLLGKTVCLKVLDTPGHTMGHICLLSAYGRPKLFSGDTLFNAGVGNCHFGGHPEKLFDTFANVLAIMPPETYVYPGHDYIVRNLGFTLEQEPGNLRALEILKEVEFQDPANPLISTLGLEGQINTFFRLGETEIIQKLFKKFSDLSDSPSPKEIFLALRKLRDKW